MRRALATLTVGLLVACGQGSAPAPTTTESAAKSPAVTGVTITDEGFDRDEDGTVETTHARNADGSLTIKIDTDGDGTPDMTRTVEALESPPEGFELPEDGIELQEVDPAQGGQR
ncbi:MAG: hypothetical protein R3F62_24220 [Planctomycetota bacterium]